MFPSGVNIVSSLLLPPDFTAITLPKYSPHRSRRVLKKLWKHVRASATNGYNQIWFINGTGYCHPTVYNAMKNDPRLQP